MSSISEEAEKAVRDIRRATLRQHSAEEDEGLSGDDGIAELCRKEGHQPEPLLSLVEGLLARLR